MAAPAQNPFRDELIATARALGAAGKGILAADESTGTIGKRLAAIDLENTRENRRAYRELLATTPGLSDSISGVILYEETLFETAADGSPLRDLFSKQGVLLGIKTDLGARPLPTGETYTQGLTDLDVRSKRYYEAGARFCKWRAVVRIDASKGYPSPLSVQETAWTLARYASISQANGLAPIVEPEILMDGDHGIEVCAHWTQKVVSACYKALSDNHVLLEGTLLKPNMVLPGADCPAGKAPPAAVAHATVTSLLRSVPAAVPTICFLSGGQSEEEATTNLNAINSVDLPRPWSLTFSYGRALQQSCIKAWGGKPENVKAAQEALLLRARANSEAQRGKYAGSAAGKGGDESLYQKNYSY